MDYNLNINKVVAEIAKIKKENPKVCLQLPDGLKQHATKIYDEVSKKLKDSNLKAQLWLWAGSNFGACDLPLQLKNIGFDLLINFGHTAFRKVVTKPNLDT
ncbi:MAG: diphthamide synthesis protein [Candidatus Nanoarchaeia archaeon]